VETVNSRFEETIWLLLQVSVASKEDHQRTWRQHHVNVMLWKMKKKNTKINNNNTWFSGTTEY
jgi:hypothetical protein